MLRRICLVLAAAKPAATRRFSYTVSPPNGCGIWKDRPMPLAHRSIAGWRVISLPPARTCP